MRKGIKYALFFTGGVAVGIGVCGANLISYALSDDDIREGIKINISKKIDKALYGEKPKRNKSDYVSYKDICDKRKEEVFVNNDNDIIFSSRAEAEKVLGEMRYVIAIYGVVTIADLLDITGISADFSHGKYGWTNLKNIKIIRSRDGYKINFPTPFLVN